MGTCDSLADHSHSRARDGQQPNVVNVWPETVTGTRYMRFANGKTVRLARSRHNDRDLGPHAGLFGRVGRFLAIPRKNGGFTIAVEFGVDTGPNVEASLVLLVLFGLDVLVDMIQVATREPIELQKVVTVHGRDAFETGATDLHPLVIQRLPSLDFFVDIPRIGLKIFVFKRAVMNEILKFFG
jgi:hypothetical protein